MTSLAPFRPPTLERWEVWDHYLESLPDAGFRQSSWWAALHPTGAADLFGLMIRRDGIILGGGVTYLHRWDARHGYYLMPDGPILPAGDLSRREVLSALFTAIRERRRREPVTVSHLRISPRWQELPDHLGDISPAPPPYGPAVGPRHLVSVDLRTSETGLLARMAPVARSHIALGRRFGLTVTEDWTEGGVTDLLDMMRVGRKRDPQWPAIEVELTRAIPQLLQRRQGMLCFAEDGGTRLAGAMVVHFGPRATCIAAGALQEGRQVIAPTLLQFEMMRRAKAHGCTWYEAPVGGITLDLGGAPDALTPPLDIVFDPQGYEAFQRKGWVAAE
jgi:GNAT acetyltransferase-like protein